MAERRMFAKTIVDSDAFLEMPLTTQALYFHLSMRADDDGFVNNPKRIQRMIGASDDDLRLLIAKSFVLTFESGVIVIKHWRINNYIRNDRYHETVYQEEKALLITKSNDAYTLGIPDGNQAVYQMDTEVSIGKYRLDKDIDIKAESEKKKRKPKQFVPPTLEEVTAYCKERKNNVNPKAFFDYYEAGHWVDSKGAPVKNWKQKVITWEKDSRSPAKPKTNNIESHDYDFDELERILQ